MHGRPIASFAAAAAAVALGAAAAHDRAARVSSAIVYVTDRHARPPQLDTELYLVNADGSGQRRLKRDPARDEQPAWSPDGKTIAFDSDRDAGGAPNCAGPWEVYVTDLDGRDVRRLTRNDGDDWTSARSWRPGRR